MKKNKGDRVIPILEKKHEGGNVMRGRDVRATLQNRNLDPILIDTIATLAEINHVNMKALAELATIQDQIIDAVQKFADISENMKNKMKSLEEGINTELEGDNGAETTKH